MREEKITVLVFKPGDEEASVVVLENTLAAMQFLVADGGLIETKAMGDCIDAVMDEEGKIKNKFMNRPLRLDDGRVYDVICGTFFLARVNREGDFASLTNDDIEKWRRWPPVTQNDLREAMNFGYTNA